MNVNKFLPYLFLFVCTSIFGQTNIEEKENLYLIPGQGADYRLYNNLELDSTLYNINHVHWVTPPENCTMKDFAIILSNQIDTTKDFSLIGVSLGGMICTELTDMLNPRQTIIISSAKCRSELPSKYKFMQNVPINHIVPPNWYKAGALKAQPIVEPDSKNDREVFEAMLKAKDPDFLKRTVDIIINWERTSYDSTIVHIHGTDDHTLPYNNVKADYTIDDGSHMMVYTRGAEVSTIIREILKD